MKRLVISLLLTGACATAAPDSAIGFRVVDLYDKVRTFVPGDYMLGRPLRVRLWYPALAGGQQLVVADYTVDRPMSGFPTEAWEEIVRHDRSGISAPAQRAKAALNAPPARKRYPLVVYLPPEGESLGASAAMAEHLAAEGLVVAVAPRLGPDPSQARSPDPELLAHDLRFIARQLRGLADVDEHRVIVVASPADAAAAEGAQRLDPAIGRVVLHAGSVKSLARSLRAP